MEIIILLAIFLTQDSTTTKLKEIDKKITTIKKEEKKLKQKEKSILKELDNIDTKIYISKNKIKKIKKQEEALNISLKGLNILGKKINEDYQQKEEIISDKIFYLYKHKIMNKTQPITSLYIKKIIDEDIDEHSKLGKLSDSIYNEKKEIEEKIYKLREIKKMKEKEYKNIADKRKEKAKLLKKIKKERAEKEKLVKELEKAREELEKLIAKVEKYPKEEIRRESSFIWPVKGKIVGEFGTVIDKTLGTKLINKGIDINAPYGENVVAADDGIVIYEGPFLGYGKIILIDHKNGFCTLYGYLSETFIMKGEETKKGEIIGKIGSTGIVEEPTLHFEIRKNGEAVNPLEFLSTR